MKTRKDLEARGFKGFCSVSALRSSGFSGIPNTPGVYACVRTANAKVIFLSASPAGRFKGKDPSQKITDLERRWIEGADIL